MRWLAAGLMVMLSAWTAHGDPAEWTLEGWKTDFSRMAVPETDILSGGPPKDGIPSIDAPVFKPASEVSDIGDREPVIELTLNGETKAYPLRVMTWHEIANDTVGGIPVAVTYCPLCNASIVFDRRIEGKATTFGTTGKLRNSDLVMYDRESESWWQQFTGEAIAGLKTGTRLTMIPSRLTGFAEFRAANPQAPVLVPANPSFRPYGSNPYAGYDSRSAPYPLYTGTMPQDISPMARVVVVRGPGDPLIITLATVREKPFEKDGLRIEWIDGVASALDDASIADSRTVGTVRVTRDGKDVVHDVTFAFVAHAFHPGVAMIGAKAQ
jgi:hypothetical protein